MKARQEKNRKLRLKYSKREILKKVIKFLYANILTNGNYKKNSNIYFLNKKCLNYRISKTLVKNICVLSSRSRSVNKTFNISRIYFRSMISSGSFFGYKKAVW